MSQGVFLTAVLSKHKLIIGFLQQFGPHSLAAVTDSYSMLGYWPRLRTVSQNAIFVQADRKFITNYMELLPFFDSYNWGRAAARQLACTAPARAEKCCNRSVDNYTWEAFLVSESFTPTTQLQGSRSSPLNYMTVSYSLSGF